MSIKHVKDTLRHLQSKAVSNEVKATLERLFGAEDAHTFAAKQPFGIVDAIADAGVLNALEVAESLLAHLERMGFRQSVLATAVDASEPTRIVLESDRLEDKEPHELLTMLVNRQGNTRRVLAAFKADSLVATALRKADKTKRIVVTNADGSVNVEETMRYINRLALPFGEEQRLVKGSFPVTLEKALKLENMVTVNWLTRKVNYVGEPDQFGYIISDLMEERYYALAWAATTDHPRFPQTTDEDELEDYLEQIFAPEDRLKRRWKAIFEDFAHAKVNGDPTTQGLIRTMTEEQALGALRNIGVTLSNASVTSVDSAHGMGDAAEVARPLTERAFERIVRNHAERSAAIIRITNHSMVVRHRVCGTLVIESHHTQVSDTVVLGECVINSHHNSVRIIMPPGRDADNLSHNNYVHVINMTWGEIAAYLNLV